MTDEEFYERFEHYLRLLIGAKVLLAVATLIAVLAGLSLMIGAFQ